MDHLHLFSLFYHRRGKCGFWIATRNVVSKLLTFLFPLNSIHPICESSLFSHARKVSLWLEKSSWIFDGQRNTMHYGYVRVNNCCYYFMHVNCVLFVCNRIEQRCQRKFTCLRSECSSWNRSVRSFGAAHRIPWTAFRCKTVNESKLYSTCLLLFGLTTRFSSFFFRMSSKFSDLFKNIVTTLFVWSLVTICGAMLMIQIQLVEYFILSSQFILGLSC